MKRPEEEKAEELLKKEFEQAFMAGRNFQGNFERNGPGRYPNFEAWYKSKNIDWLESTENKRKVILEFLEYYEATVD